MNNNTLYRTRRAIIGSVALGIIGGLAGCVRSVQKLSNASLAGAKPSPETTESIASTSQSTTMTTIQTPTESWTPPETPNGPIENKEEERITDGEFINTVEAQDGSGYTDFDIRVGANTWMMDVDPPKDEEGEPYFIVEIDGQFITRTDTVPFRKEGSFTIPIPVAALKQFDAGTLEIRVLLLDEDHSRDDLYGTWTTTIEYSSD